MENLDQTFSKGLIGVSSTGPGLESQVDPRFGRCAYFVIARIEDSEVKEVQSVRNPGIDMPSGAGISAAQLIADQGVKVVITGNLGPKAFQVLQSLGIEIYQGVPGTVEENIGKFLRNELQRFQFPSGGFGAGFGRGRPW